jgi:PhnB protein
MPQNPPEGYGRVTPYLYYKDSAAALDFLTRVFGFTEKVRMPDDSGGVAHAEIEFGDGVVMFGTPREDYKNPQELGGATQLVYVYVDDVDAHFERAQAAGTEIREEPADQAYGECRYTARDPEGHLWFFATVVRHLAPEEWGATVS